MWDKSIGAVSSPWMSLSVLSRTEALKVRGPRSRELADYLLI